MRKSRREASDKNRLDRWLDDTAMTILQRPLPPAFREGTPDPLAEAERTLELAKRAEGLDGIISRHEQALTRYAFFLLASRSDAELLSAEATQRVFVSLYVSNRKPRRFQLGRPLRPWLRVLAGHEVANIFREQRAVQFTDDSDDDLVQPGPSPQEALLNRELLQIGEEFLGKLTPLQRQVFIEYFKEEREVPDIARSYRITTSTVYRILNDVHRLRAQAGFDVRDKVRLAAHELRQALSRGTKAGNQFDLVLRQIVEQVPNSPEAVKKVWHNLNALRKRVQGDRPPSLRALGVELLRIRERLGVSEK